MRKTIIAGLILGCLAFAGCGKLPQTKIGEGMGLDLLKDIQNAMNNNQAFTVTITTMNNTATFEFLPKYNQPLVKTDIRKIVMNEADSKGKEVFESDIQYNDDGKIAREYKRHEIPPKNSSGMNMVLDKLIGQTPYFVLLLIALIVGGIIIYAKFFRNKKTTP
jgi:hypothetical protein